MALNPDLPAKIQTATEQFEAIERDETDRESTWVKSWLALTFAPGTCHTQEVIAVFCDCTVQTVRTMERKALTKLRSELAKRDYTLSSLMTDL